MGRLMRCKGRAARGGYIALGLVSVGFLPRPVLAQHASGGSEVPCAAPLAWRVVRVDREFGIDEDRATVLVREAAELWNRTTARSLFRHDPEQGFPIRLVFDERQERTQERMDRQAQVDEATSRLQRMRDEHATRVARFNEASRAHAALVRDFERRLSEHNGVVRGWNERGGAPEEVGIELRVAGEALDRERRQLEERARPLERERTDLDESQRRLDRDAATRDRLIADLNRDFPPVAVQSGEYREAIRREGERLVSVGREIRIYRFGSDEELRMIAAHELGHALGLGHVPGSSAVMAQEQQLTGGHGAAVSLTAADVSAFRATCPMLAVGG